MRPVLVTAYHATMVLHVKNVRKDTILLRTHQSHVVYVLNQTALLVILHNVPSVLMEHTCQLQQGHVRHVMLDVIHALVLPFV